MSNEDLDEVLGKFVAEVRKEGEKEYPGKTLYEMICCIQAGWAMSLLKSLKALVLTGITVIIYCEKHALHDYMTKVFLNS